MASWIGRVIKGRVAPGTFPKSGTGVGVPGTRVIRGVGGRANSGSESAANDLAFIQQKASGMGGRAVAGVIGRRANPRVKF